MPRNHDRNGSATGREGSAGPRVELAWAEAQGPAAAQPRRTEVAGAALARNWGAIALRGIAAVAFGLGVLALPPPTLASLVLLFAAYVVADGVFAILAGARAGSQPERWWTLILEGATNLAAAGAVLVWAAIAVVPLLSLASAWAIVTGALMLAAAHRYSGASGRWLLAFGGGVSAGWGALAVALAPAVGGDLRTAELWLVAYALVFGVTLLVLASGLRRRHIGPEQPST